MQVDKSLMTGSTVMLVLSLLSEREMYGYEMIAELARRSDDTFQLREGTLYPILHGLEADKCVTAFEKAAESGRMRRYYRITRRGRKRLEEKQAEWKFFTDKVEQVVFGTSPALA